MQDEEGPIKLKNAYFINYKKYQTVFKFAGLNGYEVQNIVIKHFNKTNDYNFTTFHKKKDFGNYIVSGIADGFDKDRRILIEIKSQNSLAQNYRMSLKKNIQQHVYMNLYDCHKCIFVLVNKSNGELIEEELVKDEHFFQQISEKLDEFTIRIRKMTVRDFIDLIE